MPSKVINYFRESWQELSRIAWPNRQQSIKLTVAVLIFSGVLAAFMSLVDLGLGQLVKRVLLK